MPRVVKRSASQTVKAARSQRDAPLPQFVRPQLSQPVEKPLRGLNGCMKSSSTAIVWPRGSTMARPQLYARARLRPLGRSVTIAGMPLLG
jgi:hypothetical protein